MPEYIRNQNKETTVEDADTLTTKSEYFTPITILKQAQYLRAVQQTRSTNQVAA
jgi:hypothetical protein